MNKKQKQRENILQHGFDLQRIYPESKRYGPVELCKKLHKYEVKAHEMAEEMCSYEVDCEAYEKTLSNIEKKVNEILGSGPHVFINTDPRGYALKIDTKDMKPLEYGAIHKDWGGYGIICPDF